MIAVLDFGTAGAVHKARMEEGRPYRFANELICGRIAQFLLLPIPPFGFTYFAGQKGVPLPKQTMFSEIDFSCERETLALPDVLTLASIVFREPVWAFWRSTYLLQILTEGVTTCGVMMCSIRQIYSCSTMTLRYSDHRQESHGLKRYKTHRIRGHPEKKQPSFPGKTAISTDA